MITGVGIIANIMVIIVARTLAAQGGVLCLQPVFHALQTRTRLRGAATLQPAPVMLDGRISMSTIQRQRASSARQENSSQ